ncbi:MAG: hypothetical protein ACREN8_07020 [Candidatus Dormibacteraceae bacterium]
MTVLTATTLCLNGLVFGAFFASLVWICTLRAAELTRAGVAASTRLLFGIRAITELTFVFRVCHSVPP